MRLFYAIELDPDSRQRLEAVLGQSRQALNACGRLTDPDNFHVTLLFIGEWPESRFAQATALLDAAASRHRPFTLTLDSFGVFGGAGGRGRRDRRGGRPGEGQQILWLGDSRLRHPPASPSGLDEDRLEMLALVRDLRQMAAAAGIEPDTRPFFPHLTITRKLPVTQTGPVLEALPPFPPIRLHVARLVLMQSIPQAGRMDYQVVHAAPLGPPAGGEPPAASAHP